MCSRDLSEPDSPPQRQAATRCLCLCRFYVLRENIRSLLEKGKAQVRGDPSLLNSFLDPWKEYWVFVYCAAYGRHHQRSTLRQNALGPFLRHPAIAIRIEEVGETGIVSARVVEPGAETSVPDSNGRLV